MGDDKTTVETNESANWPWWHSRCEERWSGPFASRDEAIADAISEYDDDYYEEPSFWVCQAQQGNYKVRFDADWFLERLFDMNEERVDPEGDSSIFPTLTREQEKQLEDLVEAAIKEFASKNGFSLTSWCFLETAANERIDLSRLPYEDAVRAFYHRKIAAMGWGG